MCILLPFVPRYNCICHKSYRSYVMVTLSKKEVKGIIEEINKKKVALIDTKGLEESAKKVLKK